MTNNNEGLSRDALIERVRDELAGWPIGSGFYQTSVAVDEAHDMSEEVVDATLRAVADDLEAHYDDARQLFQTDGGWLGFTDQAYLDGIEAAAERVRGLLGKDAGQ